MSADRKLFDVLGIARKDRQAIEELSALTGIAVKTLKFYHDKGVLPPRDALEKIGNVQGIAPGELTLALGHIDRQLLEAIQGQSSEIYRLIAGDLPPEKFSTEASKLALETEYGKLYRGDCLELLPTIAAESVDLIFADPPFNLDKEYPSGIDDSRQESDYLRWCEVWLEECIRILKDGGSLFLWNLPKWNLALANFLNSRLTFRHWIAVDIKYRLPIAKRLYPSHYSLLYYCKGDKPKAFHPDRLPLETCPHCDRERRDYGGYKDKMNPKGVNLTDVWYDIPPVRHHRYKHRQQGNELSLKLVDRVIELASEVGDTIFDPFGGSGTTYAIAELKRRRWLGIEIGPVDDILKRFTSLQEEREYLQRIRDDYNCLFTPKTLKAREKKGFWTPDSVRETKAERDRPSAIQVELNL